LRFFFRQKEEKTAGDLMLQKKQNSNLLLNSPARESARRIEEKQ